MNGNNKSVQHSRNLELFPGQKRIEFNLGYACNNRCLFCSELQNRDSKNGKKVGQLFNTELVLKEMQKFYKNGYRHITFLGGEPTIRKDFLALVKFAKKIGFLTIFLTTNGRMLSNIKFAEALRDAGINKLYLSLHGDTALIHDAIVQSGGAFDQLLQGIENLKQIKLPFNLTSVINNHNLERLDKLLELEIDLGARRIFWAFVRPVGGARENFRDLVPTFDALKNPLDKALQIAQTKNTIFTVGHVPFCRMQGFESFIDELYWSDAAVEREVEKFCGNENNMATMDRNFVTKEHYKIKQKTCVECKYMHICEGVHTEYVNRRGFGEFLPVAGEKILDPGKLRNERFLLDE